MTSMIRLALAAVLAVAVPSMAFAAEEHGATKSPLDPNLINSIVTVVVFLALLAVLYKFAWGPIRTSLDEREENQFKALEEARLAREEAAAMRVQVDAQMAKAQEEIRGLLEEARRDADVLRQKEKEVGVKEAQVERDRAKREIEAAKDAALKEIYEKAVDIASMMSAKAISRKISPEDHSRLLDESLAELSATYPSHA